MQTSTDTSTAADGTIRHIIDWTPNPDVPVRGAMVIAHGMAEYGARYARLAEQLTAIGIVVSAADHRGHGRTAEEGPERGIFSETGGWSIIIDDLRDMIQRMRDKVPDVPLLLLGHSMGGLISQQLLTQSFHFSSSFLHRLHRRPFTILRLF